MADRPSPTWFDQLRDLAFGPRFDAADPPEPPPAPQPIYVDDLPPGVQRVHPGDRLDSGASVVNDLAGFGGNHDKGAANRVNLDRTPLSWVECEQLFEANGYGKFIATFLPRNATRKGWKIVDGTPDTDPLAAEVRRLHLVERVAEWATWAAVYGGSVLLPVLDEVVPPMYRTRDGGVDPRWYETPLQPQRVRAVRNLIVLTPLEASAAEYEGDWASDAFGGVRLWQVSPITGAASVNSRRIHHSRVLYLPGERLPATRRYANGGYDASVFQHCAEQIYGKSAVDNSGRTLASEAQVPVFKVQGLAGPTTGDMAATVKTKIRTIMQSKSALNGILIDAADSYEVVAPGLAGWKDLDDQAKWALIAVSGIPATVWGEAPGGLGDGGENQRQTAGNLVAAYQENRLREPLTKLYELLWVANGGAPAEWALEFLPLDELTSQQTADLRKTNAETDAVYISAGVLSPEHVTRSRFSAEGYSEEILPVDEAELDELSAEDLEPADDVEDEDAEQAAK